MTSVSDAELLPVLPRSVGPYRERWLVLHGWAQGAAYWTPVARRLASRGVRLLCPDMPAAAASCRAPAGSLERLAELVDLFAERCEQAGPTAVIGHSAGSAAAILLAHRLRALEALVLVEPLPHHIGVPGVPAPATWAGAGDTQKDGELLAERLRRWYPFASSGTLQTIATKLQDEHGAVREAPRPRSADGRRPEAVFAALTTLMVEVILVRGAHSALFSAEHSAAVAASAPVCRTHVIEAAGHSAHVDRPREVADLLLRLIVLRREARSDEGPRQDRSGQGRE